MIEILKPIKQLTPDDMAMNPLWEYTNRDGADETFVRAVKDLPVTTLSGRVVAIGAPAVLAGSVEQEPQEKLTSAELMAMAFS